MSPNFQRSSKSQSPQINLLLAHGWREEDRSHDLWRWRQPRTGALFTLKDAIAVIQSQRVTLVTRKTR